MYGISQFSGKFLDKSPFKNVEKPAKPEMSESEKKLMKQTMSITDKTIREQEYPGKHGVIIGETEEPKEEPKDAAPKMSALNNVGGEITKPSYTGGYVGGGDIEGGYYVSTSKMNEKIGKTLKKVGNAIGGSIEGAAKGNIGDAVGGSVGGDAAGSSDGVTTSFGNFMNDDTISGMFGGSS